MPEEATIREFLVAIGYSFKDESEWAKALRKVEKAVTVLATVLTSAEGAVLTLIRRTAIDLENTQWAAERSYSSVSTLKALNFAFSQTGGASAIAPVEALAASLRTTPGLEGLLRRLSVSVKEKTAEGEQLRDMGDVLLDFIEATQKLPYVVGKNYAEWFGISEKDYEHLRRNLKAVRRYAEEERARAKAMGLDRRKGARNSALMMQSYRSFMMQVGAVLDGVVLAVSPDLVRVIESLNSWIRDHRDDIVEFLRAIVKVSIDLLNELGGLVATLVPVAETMDDIIEAAVGSKGLKQALYLAIVIYLSLMATRGLFRPLNTLKWFVFSLVALFLGYRLAQAFGYVGISGQIPGVPDAREKGRGGEGRPSTIGKATRWVKGLFGGPTGDRDKGGRTAPKATPEASLKFKPSPGPALDRSEFEEELKDPRVRARLFAIIHAEVGSHSEEEIVGFIETIFNRAKARKQSLWQTLHGRYWDARTLAQMPNLEGRADLERRYKEALDRVRRGSNTMKGATGNASQGVGFGRRGVTIYRGKEDYGVEEQDVPWWKRNFLEPNAPAPMSLMKGTPWGDPTRAIKGSGLIDTPDDNSITTNKSTKITVYGDTDPHKTADDVSKAIGRSNDDMVTSTQRAASP